jgi:polysaccharide pyruvyl transferase WcaK-like protein
VPIVGVILVHHQPEYGARARDREVSAAIERLLASREVSSVHIDTRLDSNTTALRTPVEVEALIARMDAVITTRLHGLVLAIKNGVPVLPIDAVAGGAKVQRQTRTIQWPVVFTADTLTDNALREAFDYCLTPQARDEAEKCRLRAVRALEGVKPRLLSTLSGTK